MRRFLGLIVIPVIACVVLAGCGSSKPAPSATQGANTNAKVTVTGGFGITPKVNIPKLDASNNLTVKTVVQGTGPALTKTDSLVANFVLYLWQGKTSTLKATTFTTNPAIISGTLIPGLQAALYGQKVGSRVLAVIPPAEGYGTTGSSELGVGANTTLVFVIDLLKAYSAGASASGTQVSNGGNGLPTVSAEPGKAPVVTIPASSPPSTLVVKTLIKGTGPVLAKGEYVIAQYVGYIWRTKKQFPGGSSWTGTPFGFIFQDSPPQVIPGWDTGLVGQTVGSRVMLVIPPKDGYGSAGASQADIKGTDVLVYVVDILDAFKKG
jgi:FKBP-type peptidyl-prolyl cis-trans isomerase